MRLIDGKTFLGMLVREWDIPAWLIEGIADELSKEGGDDEQAERDYPPV